MSQTIERPRVKVWDPLVRYGHWALVAAYATAYLSGEEQSGGPDQLPVWSGYAVGIIVVVRIVWGLTGTQHARFSDFNYSTMAAVRYFGDLVQGHARRYLGHSPIGAAMVVALLVCLTATVGTGLIAYSGIGKEPLEHSAGAVVTTAQAEREEISSEGQTGKGGDSIAGEVHSTLANITLGLIILHILGVGLASVMHRENLVGAMFTGKKRPEDEA